MNSLIIIQGAIQEAIRQCNRNLYEWYYKNKVCHKTSKIVIPHQQSIDSIIRNWLCRELRGKVQNDNMYWMSKAKLHYKLDDEHNIEHIELSVPKWYDDNISMINTAMALVDFKTLKYTAITDINFDNISKIHF